MIRRFLLALCCASLLTGVGCSGMRSADGYYTVHAESFRIFGFPIPEDDQAAAAQIVAAEFPDGKVVTTASTPADWTSFWGFFGNLFGFHSTIIAGETGE